jgi:antitoxin (DNA-binding transcriptional repressor) of toxin-antitoxin stability system
MQKVGLKVLKNKLSEYVRLAAGGETVLVTDRDRVVAEIVPPQSARASSGYSPVIARLIREGVVTPATRPLGELPPRKPVMSLEEILKGLDEDRADR